MIVATRTRARASKKPVSPPDPVDTAPPSAQTASGRVESASWDDPKRLSETGVRQVHQVHHYRRADPLLRLYANGHGEVTRDHLDAARRLRDDWDRANRGNLVDSLVRLSAPAGGVADVAGYLTGALAADGRVRAAQAACGDTWDVVHAVVVEWRSLAAWAQATRKIPDRARERLSIGLDAVVRAYDA